MLPLTAEKTPATPAELAAALTAGLAAREVAASEVRAEGAALETLTLLRVGLTGAHITRGFRVSAADSTGEPNSAATFQAARLEITGAPLDFEGLPLHVDLQAERAALRCTGLPGEGALILTQAHAGRISLFAALADLETLLQRLAASAAEKQGLEIKRVKIELTTRGPQALSFRCTVTAKMFVMSADLALNGELTVDEQLTARLSGLALGGDAMVTKLAGGFLRPHLDRLEGPTFPLATLTPTNLPLREVELSTTTGLEIRAKFGGD